MAAGAPLVPAVVLNSEALIPGLLQWPKPIVTLRFGMPIRYDGAVDDAKNVAEETDAMMRAIAALLPPEGRGVYADEVDSQAKTVVPDENLAGQ